MGKNRFEISKDDRYLRHAKIVDRLLPHTDEYGYYAIHCFTISKVEIGKDRFDDTILNTGKKYSETINLARDVDIHQRGYSKYYSFVGDKQERKISQVVSCYVDGYIVSDGYLDIFMEKNNGFNPHWFMYKVHRHLQLTKEVLSGIVDKFICVLTFKGIERFEWELYRGHHISEKKPYSGYYENIERTINLSAINGRDKWDIKMEIVEDILLESAKVFGFDRLPQKYWEDGTNEILYSKGMSNR